MEEEWITTVEALRILECTYEQARTVLKRFDCAQRGSQGRATLWRRCDVLAAAELAKLGLPKRVPRTVAPKSTTATGTLRPCMCCTRPFPSEGIHHRLCASCRQRDPGMLEYGTTGGPRRRR